MDQRCIRPNDEETCIKNKVDKLFTMNLTGCAILLEKAIIKIIFKLKKLHYFNTHYNVGDV